MPIINLIKDTVFPRFCCGCGAEGALLCVGCLNDIRESCNTDACGLCGGRAYRGSLCQPCRRDTKLSGLIHVGGFEGALKEVLHALKYEDVRAAAEMLGGVLADKVKDADWPAGLVVPVPLHPNRQRERGYNQSELIAKALAKQSGWQFLDALEKIKDTKRQTELSRGQRIENLKGAFRPRFDLTGYRQPIYLFDDVLTTGATLLAATLALKKAGAKKVIGITVATGQ